MRATHLGLAALLILPLPAMAEQSLQQQIDALKEEIQYVKQNYERTEPGEVIKQVTEYVSPDGEIFSQAQKDALSSAEAAKLEERVTFRKLKFARREGVGEKIDAAVSSAINGHVIVGLELLGSYFNTVGAGDEVDATGATHSANRGHAEGALDITLAGKPMRNTLLFVDLDGASGTPVVSEAWVAVTGPRKLLSLQAGIVDLTGSFDTNLVANDETTRFLSPAFVNSPLLQNPANGPGAVLSVDGSRFKARVGAQNMRGAAVDPTDDLYLIAEVAMIYHLFGDANWRVWGRQLPRGSKQLDQALGFSVDHRFTQDLTAFGRYSKNSYVEAYDEATGSRVALNAYDWSASGGFELANFRAGNLKERIGIAYGRSAKQDGSSEDLVEVYHRLPLTPNFAVGMHYQAAFSRLQGTGLDPLPASHTLGLRVQSNY